VAETNATSADFQSAMSTFGADEGPSRPDRQSSGSVPVQRQLRPTGKSCSNRDLYCALVELRRVGRRPAFHWWVWWAADEPGRHPVEQLTEQLVATNRLRTLRVPALALLGEDPSTPECTTVGPPARERWFNLHATAASAWQRRTVRSSDPLARGRQCSRLAGGSSSSRASTAGIVTRLRVHRCGIGRLTMPTRPGDG